MCTSLLRTHKIHRSMGSCIARPKDTHQRPDDTPHPPTPSLSRSNSSMPQNALQDLLSSMVSREGKERRASATDEQKSTNDPSSDERSDLDKVVEYLQQESWSFNVDRDRAIIHTSATGSNGSYRIILDVKAGEDKMLIVYIYCPSKVPEDKRLKIAEFITRANYGVMIGNFEEDFSDGEVRYKGALEYTGGELTGKMIEQVIQKCAFTMNRYFPGIMRVIYGDVEAVNAIREIEPSQGAGDCPSATPVVVAQLLEALAESEGTTDADASSPPVAVASTSPEQ